MLMKCICGLTRLTTGCILVEGKKVGQEISIPDSVGAIIEVPGFLPNLSGMANLKYLAGLRGLIGEEQIREAIRLVGLDEPMNGLDKHGVADMKELLLSLRAEGKTILLASHHMEDIEQLCDVVYEMEDGHLKEADNKGGVRA